MSDKSSGIAPCPFCGGTDTFVERNDLTSCFVQCDSRIDEHSCCGVQGPIGLQESDDEEMPGRDAAIAAWNRRASLVLTAWKLVPIEPTEEMVNAAINGFGSCVGSCGEASPPDRCDFVDALRDGIAAAPVAPAYEILSGLAK